MIVASIPITFKSGRAADLLGHMTETGREYEFVPDITLPEGCSAAIEIVKPDGMFVISECSIVEGNIIVTLPAQALAVRGMAHYIISITTADNKIIFSAAGSIWVDDALITNELLESISEVYGLTFPDDFLTTADLADYVTIDDLAAALTPYALKSELVDVVANPSGAAAADLSKIKIGSDVYKIPDPLDTYTEQEHIVGKWIDGSNLYEKVITFTNKPLASSDIALNIGPTSIAWAVAVWAYDGQYVLQLPYTPAPQSAYYIGYFIHRNYNNDTVLSTRGGSGISGNYSGAVIIRYVKTEV